MSDAERHLRKHCGKRVKKHKFLKKKMIFELYIKVFLRKKAEKGEKSHMA